MDVRERTLGGRYRLTEVIGRGGMSTVYRATDEVLDRTVAVKVLLPALAERDPTYAARFEREARAAAALASSAVVTVFDTGADEDGAQFIVMEFVAGSSLAELLADGRPLEMNEAIRIARSVADALVAADAAGILHRDIKPANVMVAEDGTVKLLDFGIARRLDGTTLTQSASVIGTAAYMAPERALGQPGDARSDIYSLGCLLYGMLTGRPPFSGEITPALLHQQVNAAPIPPSRLRPEIPAGIDALVLATLAKSPEARPQTAAEVRDRLAGLAGLPGAAPTAATVAMTLPGRAGRRSVLARVRDDHRLRAVVIALVTALLALVAIALLAGGSSNTSGTHRTPPQTATNQARTAGALAKPATSALTTPAQSSAPAPTPPPAPATKHPASHHGPPGSPGPPGKHRHGKHGGATGTGEDTGGG